MSAAMDTKAAAAFTGVSVDTIRAATADSYLTARWMGAKASKPVYEPDELIRWIKSRPTEKGGQS